MYLGKLTAKEYGGLEKNCNFADDMTIDYIDTARELINLQKQLKADLPYHMNIVDAIGADENANSRILAGILAQHTPNGDYGMLKTFAKQFFYATGLAEMINTPVIITEQHVRNDKRIDIYIYEQSKYAIILENKVMNAPEQPHQLANYIEGLNDMGFMNDNIYIGYLPSTSDMEPSEISWTSRSGRNYRDEFYPRFCNISFRDALLPWLRKLEILCDDNDMLKRTLAIYIDYLEGLWGFRPNEHFIDMKTDEYIAQKLAFTDNSEDNLQKAMEVISEIENLKKNVIRRKREDAKHILYTWLNKAKAEFPEQNWEDRINDAQFPSIGFPMSFGEYQRAFKIFIQIDHNHNLIYYGVYVGSGCDMSVVDARDLLKPIMDGLDKFTYAVGIKMFTAHVTAKEGYIRFTNLVRILLESFA